MSLTTLMYGHPNPSELANFYKIYLDMKFKEDSAGIWHYNDPSGFKIVLTKYLPETKFVLTFSVSVAQFEKLNKMEHVVKTRACSIVTVPGMSIVFVKQIQGTS